MDHLIRFTTAEGVDGSHQAGSLEEAIAFAERLRNVEGATDVRLFRLQEVAIEFKTYYRVEVAGGEPAEPSQAPSLPTATFTPSMPAQHVAPSQPVAAGPVEHGGPPPVPLDAGPRLVPAVPGDASAANGRRLFSR